MNLQLLDETAFNRNATRYMSVGDLKSRYGDKVDDVAEEIAVILRIVILQKPCEKKL